MLQGYGELFGKVLDSMTLSMDPQMPLLQSKKEAKIRNRNNQAPHLTQYTNGKVTTSQSDITHESQVVSPF